MVPMPNHTTVNNKPLNLLIKKEKLDPIIARTRKGGAEIVKLLEKGSAFYAPAAAGVEMAESYINNLKKTLPCAAYLNGEYNAKNIYAGVPVIISNKGVEKIVEITLTDVEKKEFAASVDAVRKLYESAKKIDSSL
jgi:malate dehydrogenase